MLLIKRPCLLVKNLERSLTLYQDILGFKLTYQCPADSESYLYPLFNLPPQAQLTFVSCDTPDTPRSLALVEVKNVSPDFFEFPARIALVIQVDSLEPIIAKIKALGLKVLPAHCVQSNPSLVFTEQGIEDFDRNLILLYSPASKVFCQ